MADNMLSHIISSVVKLALNICLHRKVSVVEARGRMCSASAIPQRWWTMQGKSYMASALEALATTKCQNTVKPFEHGISRAWGRLR